MTTDITHKIATRLKENAQHTAADLFIQGEMDDLLHGKYKVRDLQEWEDWVEIRGQLQGFLTAQEALEKVTLTHSAMMKAFKEAALVTLELAGTRLQKLDAAIEELVGRRNQAFCDSAWAYLTAATHRLQG